jgi:hypothetical protein
MFQEEGQQLLFMHGLHHVLDIKEAIMDTPLLMKVLWHLESKESSRGVNLFASSLMNSFVTL